MKIMIIEDNRIMADAIKLQLRFIFGSKLKVVDYLSISEAVNENFDNYDLVICDLNLPDSKAEETLNHFSGKNFNSKFLFISGTDYNIPKNNELNFDYDYILKDSNFNEKLNRYFSGQKAI